MRHWPQRLPQKLKTTTAPLCSERRTLLPLTACKAKSGASWPRSAYPVAAATASTAVAKAPASAPLQAAREPRAARPSACCRPKCILRKMGYGGGPAATHGEPSHSEVYRVNERGTNPSTQAHFAARRSKLQR